MAACSRLLAGFEVVNSSLTLIHLNSPEFGLKRFNERGCRASWRMLAKPILATLPVRTRPSATSVVRKRWQTFVSVRGRSRARGVRGAALNGKWKMEDGKATYATGGGGSKAARGRGLEGGIHMCGRFIFRSVFGTANRRRAAAAPYLIKYTVSAERCKWKFGAKDARDQSDSKRGTTDWRSHHAERITIPECTTAQAAARYARVR